MNLTPLQAENCTRLLIRMHAADWDLDHPSTCNCERCDYQLTVAFSKVAKSVLGGAK